MTVHLTVCMDSGFKIHPQAGLEASSRAGGERRRLRAVSWRRSAGDVELCVWEELKNSINF